MKSLRMKSLAALAAFVLAGGTAAMAQAGATAAMAQAGATVKGHVTDPAGMVVTKGEIRFTKDKTVEMKDERMVNITPIDANGDYVAKGVAPGDYFVYVFQNNTATDRQELTVKPNQNVTLDFDMTSERYMKDLTPERKKEIEDYKKKAAAGMAAQKVIAGLINTVNSVRADLKAAAPTKGDVSKDVADMKAVTDAVDVKAAADTNNQSVLWMVYGDTLQAQADHMAAEDQKAGKPFLSDDDTVKLYTDAIAAYQKGIDLNAASKKPQPADQAVAYNSIGNMSGKLGKVSDASAAYDSAVKQDPTKAGMYYGNEAIVMYKAGQASGLSDADKASLTDGAIAAADKAIAVDATRPDPYYIKAQSLIRKATVDPQTGLPVLPAGCLDAYQAFLSLAAPSDPRVAEIKVLLGSLNVKIDTSYKAPTNKKR